MNYFYYIFYYRDFIDKNTYYILYCVTVVFFEYFHHFNVVKSNRKNFIHYFLMFSEKKNCLKNVSYSQGGNITQKQ